MEAAPPSFDLSDDERPLLSRVRIDTLRMESGTNIDSLTVELVRQSGIHNLFFSGSDLTDAGLLRLREILGLWNLDVRGTKVSREGSRRSAGRTRPAC